MSLILSFLIAASLQSAAPAAPDWRPLGEVGGYVAFWDRASVVRGDVVRLRMRFIIPPATRRDYAYWISRVELRCATAQVRTVETVNYRPDDSPGTIDNNPVPWEPINPGSLFDRIRREVC